MTTAHGVDSKITVMCIIADHHQPHFFFYGSAALWTLAAFSVS
jgi:hypothetical protein